MSDHDDGFGPALTGGGRSSTAARPTGDSARPAAPPRPDGDGNEDAFGPAEHGRRRRMAGLGGLGRRGRGGRKGRTLLIVVLVPLLLIAVTGAALAATALASMQRVAVRGLADAETMNVLLVGSDGRGDLTRQQRRELGTGDAAGDRSDTILLLSVQGGRAAMLSFPRDLFVTRCDGSQGRINAAYGIDGPSCMVETVSQVSGIPITNYAEIDFAGFAGLVDAVGGVTMFIDEPINDRDAHIDLERGCQTLNGTEALGFVRVRKIDDDFGRVARQQRFLAELSAEVATPSTLLNPVRLFSTARAGAGTITADEGMGIFDMARLGRAVHGISSGNLASLTVPAVPAAIAGTSVLEVDEAEAEPIFRSFRDGSVLGRAGADLEPADIEVTVLNGAGAPGLAAEAATLLDDAGFRIGEVGNAEATAETVVQYTAGNEEQAQFLADQLPTGAGLQLVDDGPGVVLILGEDADLSAAPAEALVLDDIELVAYAGTEGGRRSC